PTACADLPETFSKFRKLVEPLTESFPVQSVSTLPPPPQVVQALFEQSAILDHSSVENALFSGGEKAGMAHLKRYFSGGMASTYKQTRNALDDFPASTKFSPWLALGCVSPRQIMSALREYEAEFGANDSTYWIGFELLWREFFFWHARKHGARLFAFSGVQRKSPATSFYPERFQKWCAGNTPYPIVNACMK
ncbi:deoxyribodipyrimidine photolyase, partial [Thalassospira xiamenensis]